ncbi:MAG: hypothetical protein JNN11_04110 [Candidatus Doudnabacteria bacterium]|nr:hypothetical protein [Candidatus Doudnabacteria bacterium]
MKLLVRLAILMLAALEGVAQKVEEYPAIFEARIRYAHTVTLDLLDMCAAVQYHGDFDWGEQYYDPGKIREAKTVLGKKLVRAVYEILRRNVTTRLNVCSFYLDLTSFYWTHEYLDQLMFWYPDVLSNHERASLSAAWEKRFLSEQKEYIRLCAESVRGLYSCSRLANAVARGLNVELSLLPHSRRAMVLLSASIY